MATFSSSTTDKNVYLELLAFIEQNKNFKAKSLLQRYKYLNKSVDNTGKTLLHISAKCGNASITQFLIECGCEVNVQDNNGETPLMLVPTRAVSTSKILLDANACMYMTDAQGTSALKKLIKNCRAEWSSLHTNRDILQVFYENLKYTYQKSTIAQKLRDSDCPLPVVILLNDTELTKCMLEIGCALDERAHGLTALHVAVQMADLENVKFLLKYGADVNGMDRVEETPLCKYRTETDDTMEKREMLKILLDQGASLNAMVTKEFGYRELIVKRLLTHGQKQTLLTVLENMNLFAQYGSSGQTPLHFLVQNANRAAEDAIRLVINKNIDVNARDKKGRTALSISVAKGFTNRIEILVANGAKATLVDIVEKTPIIPELMKKNSFREYEDNSLQKHYAKVFRLLLRYDVDFQSMPDKSNLQWNKNLNLIKLALAYLVIAEHDGRSLSASIQNLIKSKHILRDFYKWCKKNFEEIKTIIIHGSVTTYKLLTESEEKLVNYVCNQKLVSDFQYIMRKKIRRESYYHYILQKRIGKAIQVAKLREEAASAICKITGLPANEHRHIVNRIVSYMSSRDFRILFEVTKLM